MSFRDNFSWLTLTLGLVFSLILMWFGPLNPGARSFMPLLMALFMAELGFIATAAGAVAAVRKVLSNKADRRSIILAVGNTLLAINLLYTGFLVWPQSGLLSS